MFLFVLPEVLIAFIWFLILEISEILVFIFFDFWKFWKYQAYFKLEVSWFLLLLYSSLNLKLLIKVILDIPDTN